jgi:hypothetical protein
MCRARDGVGVGVDGAGAPIVEEVVVSGAVTRNTSSNSNSTATNSNNNKDNSFLTIYVYYIKTR